MTKAFGAVSWLVLAAVGGLGLRASFESQALLAAQDATLQQTASVSTAAPEPRDLLNRYCVSCHNDRLKTAGLALDAIDVDKVSAHAEVWEKVVLKLRSGAMPPPGLPRPDAAAYDRFASRLESELDRAALDDPHPGKAVTHRLNRAEYTNAVRDLLGLDIDGRSFLPADDSGYGFDNIADVLSLSPSLLDRYMVAAERISRLALGNPSIRPVIQTYSVRLTQLQTDRMSELLPFGTRGGVAVRHYFPVDGEYLIKIRLQRTHTNGIRGLSEPNEVELRLDRVRVKSFWVGGEGPIDPWSSVPSASLYEQTADDGLELRLPVKAGMRVIGVAFPKTSRLQEGVLEPRLSVSTYEYAGDRDLPMGVQTVEVSGPYDGRAPAETPSRSRIFVCYPSATAQEEVCAKKILSSLARRAFRRPATNDDLQTLLGIYRRGRNGQTFENGIELALRAVLVDPDFLFRVERDPAGLAPGTPYRLTNVELASRLSFFLWSSIPDDRLLDLAERGTLHQPAVLEQEVTRMLRDPRAESLVANFGGQWLYLRNIRSVIPDPEGFPDFDDNLREAFTRETELFLQSQLHDDRSVVELITANYTFVNERLARHYGIPNVYGSNFRRVTFPDDRRAGLLTQGSVLTATSYGNRTAPTIRGKWILQNLLGTPPPPPPPNIPALAESDEAGGRNQSVRERLEQHRKNAVCASCHAPMDPLGLALENFDAIGQWRTRDGDTPIDASAKLPDGQTLDGPASVRQLLLTRRDRLVQTITEKLLTYALGRGTDYRDAATVRQIARQSAGADYRWSSIIVGIVKSTPFQMRRSSASS
jgi:mono/diheme cytochrome c family protein